MLHLLGVPSMLLLCDSIDASVYVVTFLCSGADISATDTEARTPLMLATSEGHVEAFVALVERGASIDDVDKNGATVVHMAARANHTNLLAVSTLHLL